LKTAFAPVPDCATWPIKFNVPALCVPETIPVFNTAPFPSDTDPAKPNHPADNVLNGPFTTFNTA
jgi:hypothetical protein